MQIGKNTTDQEYLRLIDSLVQDVDAYDPQFVIYNAGSDVLASDPLGCLSLSRETVVRRDEQVIRMCCNKKIPVVMLLSGGYQQVNAELIADSLENLYRKMG